MSVASPERIKQSREVGAAELKVGQKVMVLQTKHELTPEGAASKVGEMICEVSTVYGAVKSLPEPVQAQNNTSVQYVHVDRSENEATYVVPLDPVTIVEHDRNQTVRHQLQYEVIPL